MLLLPIECSEAFNAWLPSGGVPLSYAIAIMYVLVDTYDKGSTARKQAEVQLAKKSAALPADLDKDR